MIPFLDLGIAQDPMLHASPPSWAHYRPGYGAFKVLTSAILTPSFNQTGPMLMALTWLAATTTAAAIVLRHNLRAAVLPHRS